MLVFGFEMPPESQRGPLVIVLVIESENLERMKQADPYDMLFRHYTNALPVERRLRDVDLVIAYEEDMAEIVKFKEKQDIAGLMRWLERGRVIRPGDLAAPRPYKTGKPS